MSEIVWSNVVMLSVLSAGVITPISFFSARLLKRIDSGIIKRIVKRNNFLLRLVRDQSARLRNADMSVSQIKLENSKLLSERKDLMLKVDDAIKRVDFIDDFFSQFFSSIDFEVIMSLIDSYPESLTTKKLGDLLDVSSRKAYAAADRLFKQKWLKKSKTKTFPKSNVWSLRQDKFDLLSQKLC